MLQKGENFKVIIIHQTEFKWFKNIETENLKECSCVETARGGPEGWCPNDRK